MATFSTLSNNSQTRNSMTLWSHLVTIFEEKNLISVPSMRSIMIAKDAKAAYRQLTPLFQEAFEHYSLYDFVSLLDMNESLQALLVSLSPDDRFDTISFLRKIVRKYDVNSLIKVLDNFHIYLGGGWKKQKKLYKINRENLDAMITHEAVLNSDRPPVYEQQMFESIHSFFGSMQAAGSNLESLTQNVAAFSETLNDLPDIAESVKRTVSHCESVSEKFEDAAECLLGSAPTLGTIGANAATIMQNMRANPTAIGLNLAGLVASESKISTLAHLASLSSLFGLNTAIYDRLTNMWSGGYTQQAYDKTLKAVGLLASFLGPYSPSKIMTNDSMGLFKATREAEAMQKIIDMALDAMEEMGLYQSEKSAAVKRIRQELTEVIADAIVFETLLATTPAKFQRNKWYTHFQKRYQTLNKIKSEVSCGVYACLRETTFAQEVMSLSTRYQAMSRTIESMRSLEGYRVEPIALALLGAAGIGKSTFQTALPKLLAERYHERQLDDDLAWEGLDDIDEWRQWFQNTRDQYHQGYGGQEIHMVDDMFQDATHADHLDFINFISSSNFPTRQAELSTKGTPYCSRLLVGSCNRFPNQSRTIVELTALTRRFNVIQFTHNGQEVHGFDSSFAHLDIEMWRTGTAFNNRQPGTRMSLTQLLDYILDSLKAKEDYFMRQSGFTEQVSHDFEEIDEETFLRKWSEISRSHRLPAKISDVWQNAPAHLVRLLRRTKGTLDGRLIPLTEFSIFGVDNTVQILGSLKEAAGRDELLLQQNFGVIDAHLGWMNLNGSIYTTRFMTVPLSEDDDDQEDDHPNFEKPWYYKYYEMFERMFTKVYPLLHSWFWAGVSAYLKAFEYVYAVPLKITEIAVWLIGKLFGFSDESIIASLLTIGIGCFLNSIWINVLIFVVIFGYYQIKLFYLRSQAPCSNCYQTLRTIPHTNVHEAYCKKHCSRGWIRNTHTSQCEAFAKIIPRVERALCTGCASCIDEKCGHRSMEEEVDDREIRFFALTARDLGFTDTCFANLLSEEDSDTSVRGKAKRGIRLEESDNSKQGKAKRTVRIEESDNSQRQKAKEKIRVEESDNSKRTLPKQKFVPEQFQQEMAADQMAMVLQRKIVDHSLVKCYRGQNGAFVHGLGYKNFIFTPAHYFKALSEYHYFKRTERVNGETIERIYPLEFIRLDARKDVCCWKFTGNAFDDTLYRHTISESEITAHRLHIGSQALQYIPSANMFQVTAVDFCKKRIVPLTTGIHQNFEDLWLVNGIRNPMGLLGAQTLAGDCGSPLIAIDKSLTSKIIGMHILGGRAESFSALLTKELLDKLMTDTCNEEEYSEQELKHELIDCDTDFPVVDHLSLCNKVADFPKYQFENIDYIGEYDFLATPATESSLTPHLLHGTFEPKTCPAILQDKDVPDKSKLKTNAFGKPSILATQLGKYDKFIPQDVDFEEHLKDMAEQLTNHYREVLDGKDLSPMTEEETLSGIEYDIESKGIDLRTSAGEPWSRLGKTKGKKKNAYCDKREADSGNRYTLGDTEHATYLRSCIADKEMLASKGYRTLSLWKNCLKDETRPIEKVNIGKTRAFTAAPFESVYLFRKWFGKFKDQFQKNRRQLFHSVGINPTSFEWTTLVQDLQEKGTHFHDADFGSYDGNQRRDVQQAVIDIIVNVIDDAHNDTLMRVLLSEVKETFQVTETNIHLFKHGNPSGNPLTTVFNCIINLLYHWYAFRKITGQLSLSLFQDQVGFTCFGDDVLFTTPDYSPYTFAKIADVMEELGQEYTTAAKDGRTEISTQLSSKTFLKRRFVPLGSTYLAPLDTASIEGQFNWSQIEDNDLGTISQQLKEATFEAGLHGEPYFTSFVGSMRAGIKRLPLHQKLHLNSFITYADARRMALGRIDGSIL